jgi:hypothetical protein
MKSKEKDEKIRNPIFLKKIVENTVAKNKLRKNFYFAYQNIYRNFLFRKYFIVSHSKLFSILE